MISKANVQFIRISPRKVRYVIDLIRKKNVRQAQAILGGAPRRAAEILRKLLDQAVDAAEKNSQIPSENLFISKVTADGGPTMRRFRAASMGRASIIRKRTSHIELELDVLKNVPLEKPQAKTKAAAIRKPAPESKASAKKTTKASSKKMVGAK